MLLFTVLLLTSSLLPVLAAPIPIRRLVTRAAGGDGDPPSNGTEPSGGGGGGGEPGVGWPHSLDVNAEKASFSISGNLKQDELQNFGGGPVLRAEYPEGSYAGATGKGQPGIAGYQLEGRGPPGLDLKNAQEVVLTYQWQFQEGFEWAEGGKMPGLNGVSDGAPDNGCSGGHKSDDCWSGRIMWRKDGELELYGYFPEVNKNLPICKKGSCNLQYGISIGRGNATATAGQWITFVERVKLNTVGKGDGEIEVTVNGKSAILVQGLQLRVHDSGRFDGVMIHTFFGGSSSPDFKSPKTQYSYSRNYQLQVTQSFGGKNTTSQDGTGQDSR